MRSRAKAEILCETKARRPLINPKPIHTIRAEKVGWGHPVMRAKLADAYSRAGGGTIEDGAGRPDPSVSQKTSTRLDADDESLWAFFPILLGAAAIFLLMFFFISPSFKVAEPVPAPGTLPVVTDR